VKGFTTTAQWVAQERAGVMGRELLSTGRAEGTALGCKASFKARGAVAIVAGPALSAVQIAAAAARMSVLHFQKIEGHFPVRTLFLKRGRAVANLNPLHAAILELARFGHVSKIFVSGDRATAERSFFNGAFEGFHPAGLDSGGYKISHRKIVHLGPRAKPGKNKLDEDGEASRMIRSYA
jgi:hypothetical protein